jgi:hypothetical protein
MRYEDPQVVSPSWETLARLLEAAGAVPHLRVEPLPVVAPEWLADVDRIRALTPEDRLREGAHGVRYVLVGALAEGWNLIRHDAAVIRAMIDRDAATSS